jgi:hypothetical protein
MVDIALHLREFLRNVLVVVADVLEVRLTLVKVLLSFEDIRHSLEESVLKVVFLFQGDLLEFTGDFLVVAFEARLFLDEDVLGFQLIEWVEVLEDVSDVVIGFFKALDVNFILLEVSLFLFEDLLVEIFWVPREVCGFSFDVCLICFLFRIVPNLICALMLPLQHLYLIIQLLHLLLQLHQLFILLLLGVSCCILQLNR